MLQNRLGVACWLVMNAASLVPDDLWEAIAPLLPKEPPKPTGRRPHLPNRAALGGISFVLRNGGLWRWLSTALGGGSGTTCWRRLREWQAAGIWQRLHEPLLTWLGDAAAVDWSRASVDAVSVRANRGASRPGRTRSTEGSLAPSIISWWTATGFRSPFAYQRPTGMTPPSCSQSSMPSRRSLVRGGNRDGHASARASSTPTRPTTPHRCAAPCVLAASPRAALGVASLLRAIVPIPPGGGALAWLRGHRRLGVRSARRAGLRQGLLHLARALICVCFLGPVSG